VFIRITEFSDLTDPVVSFVRLKPLNQCDLFAPDAFEERRNLSSEIIWTLTYRKLQALIDGFGVENYESVHKVVKSGAKGLNDLTHVNREVLHRVRKIVGEMARVSSIWFRDDNLVLEFPELFYSSFEIRQAFLGPLYSTIGVIQ
jgi:hypothetical protein